MKNILLFIIFFKVFNVCAQNSLNFNTSIKNFPKSRDLTDREIQSIFDNYTSRYAVNTELEFLYSRPYQNWAYSFSISHIYARSSAELNQVFHPEFGLINNANASFKIIRNLAGIKLGAVYKKSLHPRMKPAFHFTGGLQSYINFYSYDHLDYRDIFPKVFRARGENSGEGFLYGVFLRPAYLFSITNARNSPWRFCIFAEGDMLFSKTTALGPIFLLGLGLSVEYQFH